MPVVFALLIGPGLSLALDGEPVFYKALLSRLYNGMDSFPLMALPFFILAGHIMNTGGITRSIVNFSQAMIGHVRGGLAQVNICSSLLFAGLSGSAVADASALGKIFIPAMHENGYTKAVFGRDHGRFVCHRADYSAVPASCILYAFIMNVSVAGLFAAGLVPGLLIAFGLMAMTGYLARRRGYPVANRRSTWRERGTALRQTLPALLTPVILLGGITRRCLHADRSGGSCLQPYAFIVTVFYLRTLKAARYFPRVRIFRGAVRHRAVTRRRIRDICVDYYRVRACGDP